MSHELTSPFRGLPLLRSFAGRAEMSTEDHKRILWSNSEPIINSDKTKTPSIHEQKFASPSLVGLTTPLKERILGQQELAYLIEKVKAGLFTKIK